MLSLFSFVEVVNGGWEARLGCPGTLFSPSQRQRSGNVEGGVVRF